MFAILFFIAWNKTMVFHWHISWYWDGVARLVVNTQLDTCEPTRSIYGLAFGFSHQLRAKKETKKKNTITESKTFGIYITIFRRPQQTDSDEHVLSNRNWKWTCSVNKFSGKVNTSFWSLSVFACCLNTEWLILYCDKHIPLIVWEKPWG